MSPRLRPCDVCQALAPRGGARALLRAGWRVPGHGTREAPNKAAETSVCPRCRPMVDRYAYSIGRAPR